jgi:hypothetical protein
MGVDLLICLAPIRRFRPTREDANATQTNKAEADTELRPMEEVFELVGKAQTTYTPANNPFGLPEFKQLMRLDNVLQNSGFTVGDIIASLYQQNLSVVRIHFVLQDVLWNFRGSFCFDASIPQRQRLWMMGTCIPWNSTTKYSLHR